MSKKVINQNANFDAELLRSMKFNFIFDKRPINRLKDANDNMQKNVTKIDKEMELSKLKEIINSIEDCSLKDNSNKMVLGDGNINSPVMLVGEAPDLEDDKTGLTFSGEVGGLKFIA
jgi:DNA polymerase